MGGGARHGCDPPHGAAALGADEEVTGVALSIAFGVTGRRLGIGRRVMGIEQPAAEGEVVAASAIGEEAVVANALEAFRKDVNEKATDELLSRERHGLAPAPISIVPPTELNLPIVEIEQSVVGDGDAMGVARDVPENIFRSGKGRFGVDHPLGLAGGSKVAQEGASRPEWLEG